MKNLIKLFEPNISNKEIQASKSVLKSKFWASGSGIKTVRRFEESFSKYVGSKKTVCVNSGSAALHLGLSLFNIKNKEVIVPSFTFVSTIHSIVLNGGKPVFADINPNDLCINIDDVRKKISSKTEAIITVHFGGMPSNLKELRKISVEQEIPVIEDAAHACGSSYQSKKIGSHSNVVCFSFHPVKNLSMPAGGAISLNDKDFLHQQKLLNSERWCGIEDRKGYYYDVKRIGWNYYLNEISAAIGLSQLKRLDKLNKIRKNIAKQYSKLLNLEFKMPYSDDCSYHLYWIRVKNRKSFMKKMALLGIETGIHYNPVHLMTLYRKYSKKLPITEKIANEIVSIPMHTNLTKKQIEKIISSTNKLAV